MREFEARPKKLAQRLAPVLAQLQRQAVVETVTHRQQQKRADVIENLVHRQQSAALSRELNKLNNADIAHLLNMLPTDKRLAVWQQLNDQSAGDVLVELNETIAEDLIEVTEPMRLSAILGNLDIDELTEIADLLPAPLLNQAISSLEANERNWVERTLSYPQGTVGDNMSKDSLTLSEHHTINQAIEQVRSTPELPPQTYKL